MVRAIWNGAVIAESDRTVVVDGNHDFPPDSVRRIPVPCDRTSHCAWKGTASYFDVVVEAQTNEGAAWYYAEPLEAASHIKDHVAFWRGVTVEA